MNAGMTAERAWLARHAQKDVDVRNKSAHDGEGVGLDLLLTLFPIDYNPISVLPARGVI